MKGNIMNAVLKSNVVAPTTTSKEEVKKPIPDPKLNQDSKKVPAPNTTTTPAAPTTKKDEKPVQEPKKEPVAETKKEPEAKVDTNATERERFKTMSTDQIWLHFGGEDKRGVISHAMRYLTSIGFTTSEVAKMLNKRYQHVRNVLTQPVSTKK